MAQYFNWAAILEKGLIPIIILALVFAIFGLSATWALISNVKVIIYIVAGIIGLKLLQLLRFKK